ncbi:MAG TPA: YifB family Mg chelatase-like AAA ATPase [Gemmatimonadales bacterium]|nr:YifB family Mg chelatase-like AAA ATPase [Gemmatimonadales bacterium]
MCGPIRPEAVLLARIHSASVLGVEALGVDVEVDIASGLPSFTTVGLPHGAVKEGRERVAAALANAGLQLPLRRITVNLAPADVPKRGSAFDLPVAIGILAASGQLPLESVARTLFLGELGLEGDLRPIRGALPIALAAARLGMTELVVPAANVAEAGVVDGVVVRGAPTIAAVVAHLRGEAMLPPSRTDPGGMMAAPRFADADFADVRAQEGAKRALEIAAAGGHNVLFIGAPGAGKTMLARRLPGILPPLTLAEALDVTRIHSVAGLLPAGEALVTRRPFRAPHHTISYAGMIGGGSIPRPGEVSLAHHGVLFLDEAAEASPQVLDVLRQPLEDGQATIARAAMTLAYPARFLLVVAMNPCPCGHAGDPQRACTCSPAMVQKYLARISGPLLDRIDIHLHVPPVRFDELAGRARGESSDTIRARVIAARERQLARFRELPGIYANAHMGPRELARFVHLDAGAEAMLREAVLRLGLSARAYHRVLKLARTLADLAGAADVGAAQVAEAVQYRVLDAA